MFRLNQAEKNYLVLHAEQCCDHGGCHAVLACSGFCNAPLFTHPLCQQSLADNVVDLVGTGVVQVFPF
jgi:hypothetical protein